MRHLLAFLNLSLDGYFATRTGDIHWAHSGPDDAEWNSFVSGNAQGGGALLFGRVTYEMMASYWPSDMARQNAPVVAERMNGLAKYVFSKSLQRADWQNSTLLSGDLAHEVKKLKNSPGPALTILGSGSLVAQLAIAKLIDEFQFVINPIVLGEGKRLFMDLPEPLPLEFKESRSFRNGKVVLSYAHK